MSIELKGFCLSLDRESGRKRVNYLEHTFMYTQTQSKSGKLKLLLSLSDILNGKLITRMQQIFRIELKNLVIEI